jgi:L-cystine uptake protein TcyP (sodium:dicarboxylate symporter family)
MIQSFSHFIWRNATSALVLWLLTIFALCAMPGEYIPSNNWLDLLSVDKLVHASIFFILCFLGFIILHKNNSQFWSYVLIVVLAIVYGASLEYMQGHYFRHRSADWLDIAANSTGCFLALIFRSRIRQWAETNG